MVQSNFTPDEYNIDVRDLNAALRNVDKAYVVLAVKYKDVDEIEYTHCDILGTSFNRESTIENDVAIWNFLLKTHEFILIDAIDEVSLFFRRYEYSTNNNNPVMKLTETEWTVLGYIQLSKNPQRIQVIGKYKI